MSVKSWEFVVDFMMERSRFFASDTKCLFEFQISFRLFSISHRLLHLYHKGSMGSSVPVPRFYQEAERMLSEERLRSSLKGKRFTYSRNKFCHNGLQKNRTAWIEARLFDPHSLLTSFPFNEFFGPFYPQVVPSCNLWLYSSTSLLVLFLSSNERNGR